MAYFGGSGVGMNAFFPGSLLQLPLIEEPRDFPVAFL
jgi:hypothetical protein